MYLPHHFAAPGNEAMHQLMQDHPLATVITLSPSGLNANHIPMLYSSNATTHGSLRGHIARSNPLLDELGTGREALVIFHGPQAYISPSWYATKAQHGKVVPTWNYAVVHAHGILRPVENASWLRQQLENLTQQSEKGFAQPWAIDDAPEDFIDKLSQAIVGIEMETTQLTGKWKISQNHPVENREGVIAGLRATGTTNEALAKLIEATFDGLS